MNEKELKDLQKFGEKIDVQPKVEKKIDSSKSINNREYDFVYYKRTEHVIVRFFKFVIKNLGKFLQVFGKWTLDKSKILKFKLKKRFLNVQYPHILNFFKKPVYYKIVETCKHSRNKTVIVRKRVSVSYKELVFSGRRRQAGSVYYLTLNGNKDDGCTSKVEAYGRLKKSSWDFPINK